MRNRFNKGKGFLSLTIFSVSTLFSVNAQILPEWDSVGVNKLGLENVTAGRSTPVFVDIDDDGDLDFFSGALNGDFIFKYNNGDFANDPFSGSVITNPFGLTQLADGGSTPHFVDIDNDGDLDMFSGVYYEYYFYYYENIGTKSSPDFLAAVTSSPFSITQYMNNVTPYFVDIDNDGDYDMLTGDDFGDIYTYINGGTADLADFSYWENPYINPYNLESAGANSHPIVEDIDKDGDLDILCSDDGGVIRYYENIGTVDVPDFKTPVLNPFGLSTYGVFASNTLADIDNDGDLDLFIGDNTGDIYFYQNLQINVGIENVSSNLNLSVYPNPTDGIVNIISQDQSNENVNLSVVNILGEVVYSDDLGKLAGNQAISVDLNDLPSGVYIVKLESQLGTYSQKITIK